MWGQPSFLPALLLLCAQWEMLPASWFSCAGDVGTDWLVPICKGTLGNRVSRCWALLPWAGAAGHQGPPGHHRPSGSSGSAAVQTCVSDGLCSNLSLGAPVPRGALLRLRAQFKAQRWQVPGTGAAGSGGTAGNAGSPGPALAKSVSPAQVVVLSTSLFLMLFLI